MTLSRGNRSAVAVHLLTLSISIFCMKIISSIDAAAVFNISEMLDSENETSLTPNLIGKGDKNSASAIFSGRNPMEVSTDLTDIFSMQNAFANMFPGQMDQQNFAMDFDSAVKSMTNNQVSLDKLLGQPGEAVLDIQSILLDAIPRERMVDITSKILQEVPADVMLELQTKIIEAVPMEKVLEIVTEELS